MKTIAILYICTGKYECFWDEFYATCEKNFYSDVFKTYYVFTDSQRILENKNDNVKVYYQCQSGWPYDTLLRYNWFCTIQDKLKEYTYCYYFNANSVVLKSITSLNIPFPTEEKPLVLNIHSHMYDDYDGKLFQPERNSRSLACISEGTYCRAYSGGFWGGKSEAIVKMCCELRDRISIDMKNGIIAIWHDQSHLQKYAMEVPHIIVERDLISSEEYMKDKVCAIVFLNKSKYGGQENLRKLSSKDMLKLIPIKAYRTVLSFAEKVHMKSIIQTVVHMVVKKNNR